MTPEQIAELIAERDTLRSQLDALQSGDELPELPEPYDLRFDENEMQSYAIEAQAMVRAKMLAELGEVEAVAVADGTFNHNCPLGTPLYTRPLPAQTSSLPERDSSKPAEAQGLFHKFNVTRTDGSDGPGGKHYGCEYFVLDVDHDQHAKAALQAYAAACAQSHPQLSADLIARHGALPAQDVNAELVEEFGKLYKKYINLLEAGRDKILELGGTCDPVDTMEMSDPGLRDARTALANAKAAQLKEQK